MSRLWTPDRDEVVRPARYWAGDTTQTADAAFAEGLAAGRRAAEAECRAERAAITALVAGLEALAPPDDQAIELMIVTAVRRLVRSIAGEAAIDEMLLKQRAKALASLIADNADAALLLHPDDMALAGDLPVPARADAALPRGTVRAVRSGGLVEDGVVAALERLDQALDAMGMAR